LADSARPQPELSGRGYQHSFCVPVGNPALLKNSSPVSARHRAQTTRTATKLFGSVARIALRINLPPLPV